MAHTAHASAATFGYESRCGRCTMMSPRSSPEWYVLTIEYPRISVPHTQPLAAIVAGRLSGAAMYTTLFAAITHSGDPPAGRSGTDAADTPLPSSSARIGLSSRSISR